MIKSLWMAVVAIALAAGVACAQLSTGTGDDPDRGGSGYSETGTATGVTAYNTGPVFSLFAKQVTFIISSTTSAGRCSLATFEVSNDSTNWVTSASWNGVMAVTDSVASKRLDQGGVSASLIPYKTSATAAPLPAIHYRWTRMKIVPHGAQELALTINAMAAFSTSEQVLETPTRR